MVTTGGDTCDPEEHCWSAVGLGPRDSDFKPPVLRGPVCCPGQGRSLGAGAGLAAEPVSAQPQGRGSAAGEQVSLWAEASNMPSPPSPAPCARHQASVSGCSGSLACWGLSAQTGPQATCGGRGSHSEPAPTKGTVRGGDTCGGGGAHTPLPTTPSVPHARSGQQAWSPSSPSSQPGDEADDSEQMAGS